MSEEKKEHRLGEIIAHWNLEHTDKERKAHLDWARRFLKESGLDRFMTARLAKPSVCWALGWPSTVLDLKLRKRYLNRTYRHRGSGARIVNLSVIHVTFRRAAGVYEYNKHNEDVYERTLKCKGPKDAARISAWKDWEGECYEYSLRTDARCIKYKCRLASRYDGNRGDSFHYGPDWDNVHGQLEKVLCTMADDLQLRYIK